jgi:hypothetical protein
VRQMAYAAMDAMVLVALVEEWLKRPALNPKKLSLEKVFCHALNGCCPPNHLGYRVYLAGSDARIGSDSELFSADGGAEPPAGS